MAGEKSQLGTEKLQVGTAVQLTEHYLSKLTEKERKRYASRHGYIRGYRLQDLAVPKPIVHFPKFGRFKAENFYEMPWKFIELVPAKED